MISAAHTTYTPLAPAEVWRLIFMLATASTLPCDVGYAPFQALRDVAESTASLEEEAWRLKTCLSITYVCRLWRIVVAEFLYEDVRIMDHAGLKSLIYGLQRSAMEDGRGGFGWYIRRLEMPKRLTHFSQPNAPFSPFALPPLPSSSSALRLSDLFRYCPRLEAFCRPCLRLDNEDIYFWAGLIATPLEGDTPLLPRLRRLEWYETDLDTRFYGNKNTLRLAELIAHAPALEYLFMSSDRPDALSRLPSCPSLHTLRINRSHYHSHHIKHLRPPHAPSVPHLTHLVLHTMLPSPLLAFLSVTGPHIRVLELAFAPQLVFSGNQMHRLLSRCPALEELAFYLGAPEISAPTAFAHPALRRVRLKLSPEEWYPYKHVLKSQFGVLMGGAFPGLREMVLHDSTRSLMQREVGPGLLRALVCRGCSVMYDDGEVVTFVA
ncbi:hypothetical protein B0H19DRAFT_1378623 [Mycena capillaripes]|nr:hypothetical protein B0H19DRAFT_1378623 [Mycena capillaripes]